MNVHDTQGLVRDFIVPKRFASNYWSATTYPNTGNQNNAMNVNFNNGNVNNNNKTNSNYVRCVRALLPPALREF